MKKLSATEYKMKTASLLATLDSGVAQPTVEGGQPSAPLTYVQYFASGDAATLLAMQQTVRQAMLARLDPHAKNRAREFGAGLTGEPKIQAMVYLSYIYEALQARAKESVKEAGALAKALDPIGQLPPQSYTRYTTWNTEVTPPQLESTKPPLPPKDQRTFRHAMQFWGDMDLSLKRLQAVADRVKMDPKFTFKIQEERKPAVDVTPERKAQLMIEFKEMFEAFAKFDQQLRRDPAVIEAATYFMNTIMSSK